MNDALWLIVASATPLVFGIALPLILVMVRRSHLKAKVAESQGLSLRKQLNKSQKIAVLGSLTAGLVHDLNNVLMVVQGSLETASMIKNDPEKVMRMIGLARSTSERGAAILRCVLDFSRGVSIVEDVDVCRVIDESEDILRLLVQKPIKLNLKLPINPVLVSCDKTHLFQALMNLIVNARDAIATPGDGLKRGTITLTVDSDIEHVLISVADTGCGIPPELMQKVFEPLFTTKPEGKGTGLGLGIISDAVHAMGGSINVNSVVGEGTEFVLLLPIVR